MASLDRPPSPAPAAEPTPPPPAAIDIADDDRRAQDCLRDADALKQDGNEHFRAGKVDEALAAYRSALGRLPKRRQTPVAPAGEEKEKRGGADRGEGSDEDTFYDAEEEHTPAAEASEAHEEPAAEPRAEECAKARAVLNGNIAACYAKLGDHKEVVSACAEALHDDPIYVKALQRRAAANEKLNTWSSLTSAQEDYQKLLTLLPPSSPQAREARRALQAVKPRAEAAQKAEMGEMVDKLKGLGNSILGNFGLSTDNFKFEPNGQGGYSVNFSR